MLIMIHILAYFHPLHNITYPPHHLMKSAASPEQFDATKRQCNVFQRLLRVAKWVTHATTLGKGTFLCQAFYLHHPFTRLISWAMGFWRHPIVECLFARENPMNLDIQLKLAPLSFPPQSKSPNSIFILPLRQGLSLVLCPLSSSPCTFPSYV